tara:strand:+ start:27868 stop:28254 length:387 start_codon:yes stop_codon:yes gene_type:complete
MSHRQTTYLIDISPKQVRVQTKAKNKLLWYDSDENKMLEFEGGKLTPVFDMRFKKLVPKVEDIYYTSYSTESNEQKVIDWMRNYGGRFGAEINKEESSNREIAVDIDSNSSSVFEYALDRQGFRYEKQ